MGNYISTFLGSVYMIRADNSDWDLSHHPVSITGTMERSCEEASGDNLDTGDATQADLAMVKEGSMHQKRTAKRECVQPPKCRKTDGADCGSSTQLQTDSSQSGTKCHKTVKNTFQIEKNHSFLGHDDNFVFHSENVNLVTPSSCGGPPIGVFYIDGMQINDLPHNLLVNIFKYLSLKDLLCRMCLVCQYWHELSHDPDLWRVINAKGQRKISREALSRLCSYSDNVTCVDISECSQLDTESVEQLVQTCTGLSVLKLGGCLPLKDSAFQSIGQHCHNMHALYMDCCFALSDESLQQIGEGCANLESLHVNQCMQISDEGIQAIAKRCPKLKVLSMDRCTKVGDEALRAVVEGCPQLQKMSCMSCNLSPDGVLHLHKLPELQHLQLHDVRSLTDDSVIGVVRHCPKLKTINLSLCQHVTDKSVDFITRRALNIRSIYLVDCKLTDAALHSLSMCKNLKKVDVGWCQSITDDAVIAISEKCPSLCYLGLVRCDKVTVATMEVLVERFPSIHYSTVWLDCKRLLHKAGQLNPPVAAAVPTNSDQAGENVHSLMENLKTFK